MSDVDEAFDRLRAIDPGRPPETRPDLATFTASFAGPDADVDLDDGRRRSRRGAGLAVALAAIAATGLVGAAVWLVGQRTTTELDPIDVVDDVPATTGAPTTTSDPPATTVATTIDDETRALVDRFASTYSAGDADAFLALLAPNLNREVIVDRDRRVHPLELVRDLYLIEADLHTTITLECDPTTDPTAVTCVPTRYDDLHRILGLPATQSDPWTLRFDDDGLVRSWNERRENQRGVDDYEREVYGPFADWAREHHPETFAPGLKPAVAGEWVVDKRDDIVELVALFAADRGVTLEPGR